MKELLSPMIKPGTCKGAYKNYKSEINVNHRYNNLYNISIVRAVRKSSLKIS